MEWSNGGLKSRQPVFLQGVTNSKQVACYLSAGEKERRCLAIEYLVYDGDLITYAGVQNH
ncbi:hypothetical protein MnBA_20810 [Marinobacterium sp. BA1]